MMKNDNYKQSPDLEYSFLEKVAGVVPGVSGYLKKEKIRDSDQRYRIFLADQVLQVRQSVEKLIKIRVDESVLEGLDRLERLCRKLERVCDSLRYAARGYSGIFDGVRVRKEELEQLVQFDHMMADLTVNLLTASEILTKETGPFGDIRSPAETMENQVDAFLDRLESRKHLLENKPE
jgi:hypothetical protein